MSPPILTTGLVALYLVSSIQAHMVMNTPEPYGLHSGNPLLQVNPLDGITYKYPCQSNNFDHTTSTVMEAGSVTNVNFTGGAQHGGGSCQFSITYDTPENQQLNERTKFKTIYTIIGGCPAQFTDEMNNLDAPYRDADQRLDTVHCGDDSGMDCVRSFRVPLPKFLKNGPAVFAWTWFNKIGNREMYMNCAPINITGGTGTDNDMVEFNSLPDIFIANYPNHPEIASCVTGNGESQVVNIPSPGRYGRIIEKPVDVKSKPSNYCSNIPPATALPTFEPNPQTSIVVDVQPSGSASSATLVIVSSTVIPTSIMGSSSSVNVTHFLTSTVIVATGTTTIGAPAMTPTNTGVTSSTHGDDGEVFPCTKQEGELECLGGGLQYGLCAHGWVIPQPVAMGTICDTTTGTIVLAPGAVKWVRYGVEREKKLKRAVVAV
ncbi:hypothetical protein QBC41DRAFT_363566 [Cercophora samala]|uniref:Lytic polysaccharide monooxygenase n=1 Tax=Cercophora samala TaxID=330535 RepID=A0AA39ZH85_9PEZI|nr:hypothetical protein QBC41DRAFT_363566 [Cercophora samala]